MKNSNVFLICCFIFIITIIYIRNIPPTYEFVEVDTINENGIDAWGRTTAYPNNYFYIEYVSDKNRCHYSGCVSVTDTIEHEINHTVQYLKYGKMWEWE